MKRFNVSTLFTVKDKTSKPVKKISRSITGLGNEVSRTSKKVNLFGRVSPFKKMSFGAKNLRGNFNDLTGSVKGVTGALGGMLGALAIGGIASLGKKALDSADDLGKLSRRVGIGVEDLSLLSVAAKKSDIDMNSFSGGLRRSNKRIVDALNDTGTAIKGFKTLGINKDDIAIASPIKRLKLIADAVQNATNKQEASRAVQQIMGDEGVKFFNLFENGWKGVASEMELAKKLGGVITQQEADNAERLNDKLSDVGTMFSGISKSLINDLLPSFESIVDTTTTWVTENKDLAKTIVKIVGGVLAVGAGLAALSVGGMIIGSIASGVTALGSTFALVGKMFLLNPIGLAITGIVAGTYLLYKTWEPATKFFDNIFGSIGKRFETFKSIFKTDGLFAAFTGTFDGFGAELFQPLIDGAESFFTYFKTEFPFLSASIKSFTSAANPIMTSWYDNIMLGVSDMFTSMSDKGDESTGIVGSTFKVLGLLIHGVFSTIEDIFKGFTLLFTGDWLTDVADNWTITLDSIKDSFSGMFNFISVGYERVKGIISGVTSFLGTDDKKETKKSIVPATPFSTKPNQKSVFSGINNPGAPNISLPNFDKPSTGPDILGPQKIESKNQIDVNITDSRVNVETSTPTSKQTKTVFNVGQNRIGGLANAF